MFGKNVITKPFRRDDGVLLVTEVFQTVQGEGPDAGCPAVFVRLSKCNLACVFCDTDFDKGEEWSVVSLLGHVKNISRSSRIDLVVITGGEPLLQNLHPFIIACMRSHLRVSIESAGTVWDTNLTPLFSNGINRLVISPKTPKLDREALLVVDAFKYIISADNSAEDDGLPMMSTQVPGKTSRIYRHSLFDDTTIYVQPMDEGDPVKNAANAKRAAEVAMRFGYRLSIQMHKVVGLP
jgi:7-carboxy-7-deazaguanine synthase